MKEVWILSLKNICANCFCASLVCMHIHMPRHASSVQHRANCHYYNSFAWISQILSWTFGDPHFSFDKSFSLPIFYV